jgi:integrase
MARSPFSVFKRSGSVGGAVYCARFFDDDGKVFRTVTLKDPDTKKPAKSPTAAIRIAEAMLKDGIIARDSDPMALEYLRGFWSPGSDYVRGRKLRGTILSARYLEENTKIVDTHLAGFLKGRHLLDITPALLERIILDKSKSALSTRRINAIMSTIRVPYAYFCRQHRIVNTLTTVEKLHYVPKTRGTLSTDELMKIIALEGQSTRVMAAVLLAALCGLRRGEVRGLQWDDVDIEGGRIEVRHNWVMKGEGLKGPKWGSTRTVPMPAPVQDALELCAKVSPWNRAGFVIFNQRTHDEPCCENMINLGFTRIMVKIGIPKGEQRRRNLVFHGLRHTFVSLARATGMTDFVTMRLAGHTTTSMMEHYSHTENLIDFKAAREAMEKAVKPAAKDAGGAS